MGNFLPLNPLHLVMDARFRDSLVEKPMRHMSFFATQQQFRDRTKTVTRRLGWTFLKPGDQVMAVVKGQGLKKGEKVQRLGVIRIVSVRREELREITFDDVLREGFLQGADSRETTRRRFIHHFCQMNECSPYTDVTRIEYAYEL